MMKAVGALWRDADAETKEKYLNMANADRERYVHRYWGFACFAPHK